MQFFHDLGWLVEQRWRDKNYDEGVFPEIAANALAETSPNKRITPWEIIRWLHTNTELPKQEDVEATFSDFSITLYKGPRFYIDIYFWLDGTTTVHQHAFSGAFQVLLGSSIHSQYSFKQEQEINAHFSTGQIILNGVELLEEGNIRRIFAGRQFIHSLFHLDRPTATIIVRTSRSPAGMPQYSYLRPYIAHDPFFKEQSAIKKIQSVSLLLRTKHPEADAFIGDLVASSDFQTTFLILDTVFKLTNSELERIFHLSTGRERFDALLEKARRRHGHLVDLIRPVFEEIQRQNQLANLRRYMASGEQRFFLALLLNVPHRTVVLDLVRERFPQRDPVDTVGEWVKKLSTTKVSGSLEPNVLGIAEFDDICQFAFRCLLMGLSMEQIKIALKKDYSVDFAKNLEGKVEKLCSSLQNSLVLKSILSDSQPMVYGGRRINEAGTFSLQR